MPDLPQPGGCCSLPHVTMRQRARCVLHAATMHVLALRNTRAGTNMGRAARGSSTAKEGR
eukprot:7038507-Alexandrium_andersonii.AAC.1